MSVVISSKLCSTSSCQLECIEICPQNKKGIFAISIEKSQAIINNKECISCLLCIPVCPNLAITKSPNQQIHQVVDRDLNSETSNSVNSLRIEIDSDTFTPFNERMTIFARTHWDESFENFDQGPYSKVQQKFKLNNDGYSNLEHAAADGAWAIEDLIVPVEKQFMIENQIILTDESKKQINSPTNEKTLINTYSKQETTQFIKKLAKLYGADLVGIAPVDSNWIYTHNRQGSPYQITNELTSAIVIAVEMDLNGINTSPKMPAQVATGLGYSKTAFTRTLLTKFIQNLGYQAIPAGNQLSLSVPLALMSGLGAYGRHGLLITKKYGSRVRLAKILTDLPLSHDEPDNSFIKAVERFCKVCKTCARKCPSASISFDKDPSYDTYNISNNPGIKKWYVNVETCYNFWVENGGDCSNCISTCEYNRTNKRTLGGHMLVMWMIEHVPWLNRIWPWIGKLTGFGDSKPAKKFWKKL